MNTAQDYEYDQDHTGTADDVNLIAPVEGWEIEDFSDLVEFAA